MDETKCCKVVLLGESGVGKTSIITRYVGETTDDNVLSTVSATYISKTMQFQEYGNQSLRYEIWDTAGQERFRALTRIFYKDASIAILVYAVPFAKSFTELKEYWYNQIKQFAPPNISIIFAYNLVISIAGNKSDLNSDKDEEEVDEKEVREFAKEIGAYFRLTSATTGQGIDDLFKSVGSKFIDPNYTDEARESKKKKSVSITRAPADSDHKKRKWC